MKDVIVLRAMIQERFDSEAAAARALGWHRQRLNRITTGRKDPDIREVAALADLFGVSWNHIAQIFLTNK